MLVLAGVGLALATALGSTPLHAAPTEVGSGRLRIGEGAPPIDAERVSGPDAVSLARLRGRVVLIDFWASWCGPCRAIMPGLDGLHRRLHDRGLTILGVSREHRATIEAHLSRSPVGYTVARDLGPTQLRYGVRAIPTLVVLDRRGRVRDVRVGESDLPALERLLERLLAEPGP